MEYPGMKGIYQGHGIVETLELEGTHKDQQVQLLAQDKPQNPINPQIPMSKHSLTSGTMESPEWERTPKDH